jgi:hypothetical protein
MTSIENTRWVARDLAAAHEAARGPGAARGDHARTSIARAPAIDVRDPR